MLTLVARSMPLTATTGLAVLILITKRRAVFLFFFIFIFIFYKNIFSFSKFIEIYPGRDLVAPLRGGRGFSVKNFAENLR